MGFWLCAGFAGAYLAGLTPTVDPNQLFARKIIEHLRGLFPETRLRLVVDRSAHPKARMNAGVFPD
jgi:hypothetical protein